MKDHGRSLNTGGIKPHVFNPRKLHIRTGYDKHGNAIWAEVGQVDTDVRLLETTENATPSQTMETPRPIMAGLKRIVDVVLRRRVL